MNTSNDSPRHVLSSNGENEGLEAQASSDTTAEAANDAREKDEEESRPRFETVLLEDGRLHQLVARPSLGTYLQQTWSRRHFIFAQARTSAFSSGRDRYLGSLWVILDPIFQVSVYALIFGVIMKTDRGMDNFIGFLTLGVVFFRVATSGLSIGSGLINSSRGIITSFKFPRISVVLSSQLKEFLDNILPVILAIIIAVLFQMEEPIHPTILLVIPLLLLLELFNFGVACIVARATAFVPDLKSFVSVLKRGLFFISGVFFSISRFETHPTISAIVEANPIYVFLMAVRTCVLDGQVPPLQIWGYLLLWSAGLAIVGLVYFWQAEERYATIR